MEQREYPRASESSLRRTDGWRLLTCPVELLRWPGPGGGVAEPAGRVTWRAGDVTAPRAGAGAEPLDRTGRARLSPRRGCPKRAAGPHVSLTRPGRRGDAQQRARRPGAPRLPVAIASPIWPRRGPAASVGPHASAAVVLRVRDGTGAPSSRVILDVGVSDSLSPSTLVYSTPPLTCGPTTDRLDPSCSGC